MAKEKSLVFQPRIELSDAEAQVVQDGDLSGAKTQEDAIGRMASRFLKEYAAGGLMLKGRDIDTIERLTDCKIQSAPEIVKAFSVAKGREDGQHCLQIPIDEAIWPAFLEQCNISGMTPEEMTTVIVGALLTDGYLLNLAPEGRTFYATEDDKAWMDDLMGRRAYTLTDVLARVRSMVAAPEAVAAE